MTDRAGEYREGGRSDDTPHPPSLMKVLRLDEVHSHRLAAGQRVDHGAQSFCGSPRATDDTSEVFRMNPNLERGPAL